MVTSLERLIGPVASEPAPADRPATGAVGPVASEPTLAERKAAEAPTGLLDWLDPREQLEDWFYIYVDKDRDRDSLWVIGITATRFLSTPFEPDMTNRTKPVRPISVDFADVTSIERTLAYDGIGEGGLRLIKTDGGWHEFLPRDRNVEKLLSDFQARVKAASS